jgi:hypothetical protein
MRVAAGLLRMAAISRCKTSASRQLGLASGDHVARSVPGGRYSGATQRARTASTPPDSGCDRPRLRKHRKQSHPPPRPRNDIVSRRINVGVAIQYRAGRGIR